MLVGYDLHTSGAAIIHLAQDLDEVDDVEVSLAAVQPVVEGIRSPTPAHGQERRRVSR